MSWPDLMRPSPPQRRRVVDRPGRFVCGRCCGCGAVLAKDYSVFCNSRCARRAGKRHAMQDAFGPLWWVIEWIQGPLQVTGVET